MENNNEMPEWAKALNDRLDRLDQLEVKSEIEQLKEENARLKNESVPFFESRNPESGLNYGIERFVKNRNDGVNGEIPGKDI